MSFIKLTDNEFFEKFIPCENVEQGEGCFHFDAYDVKDSGFLQLMATHYPNHIWTRIDGDDGCIYKINGWHIVDRIDYLITEAPWLGNHEYEVLDYRPDNA